MTKCLYLTIGQLLVDSRARTESIHFDSPKWIKNKKKKGSWFACLFSILIPFDSLSKRTNRIDSFWFSFIFYFDLIQFYSFWFGLLLIRREPRFTCESWLTCEFKSNRIKNRSRIKIESKWIANQASPSPGR